MQTRELMELPNRTSKYYTFWPRFAAVFVDSLLFFPFIIPELFWDMTQVRTYFIVEFMFLFSYTAYVTVGHGLYGYTIGKKLFNVRLLDFSENSTIGIPRALLRESIWVLLSSLTLITFALKTDFTGYMTEEQSLKIDVFTWISFGWLALELFTMLTNRKRRAIHDYIANSVVIRTSQYP